jgi:hypothetical protein
VSNTPKLKPEDMKDAFSKGPCKFGRVLVEKDPELPNAGLLPAVFCDAKNAKVFALERPWMNYDWASVYYDGKDRYVAILDWSIEGGFAEVPMIESKDQGKTWFPLSKIEKPHFSALIKSLDFDEKGNGTITLEWEPKGHVVAKLYSKDNGKTWSTGSRP